MLMNLEAQKEWITTMLESSTINDEPGIKLIPKKSFSKVTKKVIEAYNTLTPMEFFNKYQVTKTTYLRRVQQYGDPFMNSPLAKLAKANEWS